MTSLVVVVLLIRLMLVAANVEKVIFIAPEALTVPQDAAINNLLLQSLHPDNLSVRTYLNASFPTASQPKGQETWALLEGLTPGQRYELRQPTVFWLYIHTLSEVFETSKLITSLSAYSFARHDHLSKMDIEQLQSSRFKPQTAIADSSMLLLQVYATADYFTLDETLMKHVPPVHADLILDPYLLNIFPQSLLPTAGYIAVIAVVAWFLSAWIYRQMSYFVAKREVTAEKKEK